MLPRLAAKLDVELLSDLIGVDSEDTFTRLIYAGIIHLFLSNSVILLCQGNAVQQVKSNDKIKICSVRSTAFPPAGEDGSGAVEDVDGKPMMKRPYSDISIGSAGAQDKATWVSQELTKSDRPQLTTASKVVSIGTSPSRQC